jgi:hypothetical protein
MHVFSSTFYLSTFCHLYFFTRTQVVLLLITSTFNGLQIQINLGTTALYACDVPR